MTNHIKAYHSNPALKTPRAPQGWQGTPVDHKGRYLNLNHPFIPNWVDIFRWKLQKSPFRADKKVEAWRPEIYRDDSWLKDSNDVIVWFGHCTFYIRINGIQLLTDPVFGNIFPLKRHSELPVNPDRFVNINYILLSHDHRDHLDEKSLKMLSKQNPGARYLTGLNMKELVRRFTGSDNIEEAGWYQQYSTFDTTVDISFVPSRHWSKRGLYDTNKRLWGGFVIEVAGKRILFGGDSGYDSHYNELATVFGNLNYVILGIGAYEPAWFMSANHQSPGDALKAFTALNADYFIPMHYGTFDLSDEPLSQPLKDLCAAAERDTLKGKLNILDIGQPLIIS